MFKSAMYYGRLKLQDELCFDAGNRSTPAELNAYSFTPELKTSTAARLTFIKIHMTHRPKAMDLEQASLKTQH